MALDIFGVLLAGGGLACAVISVGIAFSKERLAEDAMQIDRKINEMKIALTTAKIPAEQIPGLLRVHRAAVVSDASLTHFFIVSFMFLLSLVAALVGLIIILWGKLCASTKVARAGVNAPANA